LLQAYATIAVDFIRDTSVRTADASGAEPALIIEIGGGLGKLAVRAPLRTSCRSRSSCREAHCA
jgi:hypothetical protein